MFSDVFLFRMCAVVEGIVELVEGYSLFTVYHLYSGGSRFVLWDEFCPLGRILACGKNSVLWEEFLYCGKNFCTVGRISVLREEFLY